MDTHAEQRAVDRVIAADARRTQPQRFGRKLAEACNADELYFPSPMVCARYHISDMTLWRWCKDERMQFPEPIYFGRYRYWKLSELVAWERDRAVRQHAA